MKKLGLTKVIERQENDMKEVKGVLGFLKGTLDDKVKKAMESEYRIVPTINLRERNAKMKKDTERTINENSSNKTTAYLQIKAEALKDYDGTPPEEALDDILKAQDSNLFDDFIVLSVVEETKTYQKPKPDPIVLGVIDGFSHSFFITQWDNDINILDLV